MKIDLTSDEAIVDRPVIRPILHPYSDKPLPAEGVLSYSIVDLLGEKLRALAERCRPRDLYDVVNVYRHPDLVDRAAAVLGALDQKSAHAGIAVPTIETIRASPFREEVEQEWANMLAHQLPHLPPLPEFWSQLDELFAWLRGDVRLPRLPRAEMGNLDPTWAPSRAMVSWRRGAPLELIRFAGSNRLLVEIDYRAEDGRSGPRGRRAVRLSHDPRRQSAAVRQQRSLAVEELSGRPHRRRPGTRSHFPTSVLRGVLSAGLVQDLLTSLVDYNASDQQIYVLVGDGL